MKPRTIVTAVLLAFVAASVVYLIVRETGGEPAQPPPGANEREKSGDQASTPKNKVVAYYFHGTMRCVTCRTIEAYTKEALDAGFPDAVKDGRLEWHVVNVEDPGNDHYVSDFLLATRSVVLERLVDGKCKEWKNLQRVWELVGNKDAFLRYIQEEARAYVEEAAND